MSKEQDGGDGNIISEEERDSEETILRRHKREKKELQAKITSLRHSSSKSDRTKKREITSEIARLEAELATKQRQELDEFRQKHSDGGPEREEREDEVTIIQNGDEIGEEELEVDKNETEGQVDKMKKLTRAQKRRDKKESKAKETERMIAESESQAKEGVRYKEYEAFSKVLSSRGLSFHPVPSDGDCLYNALVHQLSLRGLPAEVDELRRHAASIMKKNEDDYLPFVTNEDGVPLSHEEFEEYCRNILKPGVWGGHVELVALSTHYQRPIEILQANSGPIIIGEQYIGKSDPLIITYHRHAYSLGEHYNSTRPAGTSAEGTGAESSAEEGTGDGISRDL